MNEGDDIETSQSPSNTTRDVTKEASSMAEFPDDVEACVYKILNEVEIEVHNPTATRKNRAVHVSCSLKLKLSSRENRKTRRNFPQRR